MVVSYLTNASDQTPYTLFRWAAEPRAVQGFRPGPRRADLAGLDVRRQRRWIEPNAGAILSALATDSPVIAHMGKGVFTANGHYIVLRGIAPNGEIYVNDPASPERSSQTFPSRGSSTRASRTTRSWSAPGRAQGVGRKLKRPHGEVPPTGSNRCTAACARKWFLPPACVLGAGMLPLWGAENGAVPNPNRNPSSLWRDSCFALV